jgi:hypothetical protein
MMTISFIRDMETTKQVYDVVFFEVKNVLSQFVYIILGNKVYYICSELLEKGCHARADYRL